MFKPNDKTKRNIFDDIDDKFSAAKSFTVCSVDELKEYVDNLQEKNNQEFFKRDVELHKLQSFANKAK